MVTQRASFGKTAQRTVQKTKDEKGTLTKNMFNHHKRYNIHLHYKCITQKENETAYSRRHSQEIIGAVQMTQLAS
jgi:hypothetical protein